VVSTAESQQLNDGPWKREVLDVVRAASGGLLFGVPLLYTMEVWWVGTYTEPRLLLVLLAGLSLPLFGLNVVAGFRSDEEVGLLDAAADTVEAMAVGLVTTAAVLVLLRELTITTPLSSALGKVLYESVPFCLGIGVANLLLQGDPGMDSNEGSDDAPASERSTQHSNFADLGATAIGAAFIGLSIAPTDEVPMLASTMSPAWQLLIIAASLVTSYAIVFVAGFARQDERRSHQGLFQSPMVETVVTYLIALTVAAMLLWLFQRGTRPADDLLARVLVLGLPAAVGGAVGRLAL